MTRRGFAIFVCVFRSLSLSVHVHLRVCKSVCMCSCVCLFISSPVHLSVVINLSICLLYFAKKTIILCIVSVWTCLFLCLSLYVCISVSLSVCLSVFMYVCQLVSMFVHRSASPLIPPSVHSNILKTF